MDNSKQLELLSKLLNTEDTRSDNELQLELKKYIEEYSHGSRIYSYRI